jgi:CHAT domain-containing protein
MARKWHPFFFSLQSFLKFSRKCINSVSKQSGVNMKKFVACCLLAITTFFICVFGTPAFANLSVNVSVNAINIPQTNIQANIQNIQKGEYEKAIDFDKQGALKLEQGESEEALKIWREAAKIYEKLRNTNQLINNRINQAQAFKNLGRYEAAKEILEKLKAEINNAPDSQQKVKVLRSLGGVYLSLEQLNDASDNLNRSLKIASTLKLNEDMSDANISLGITELSKIKPLIFQDDLANIKSAEDLKEKIPRLINFSDKIKATNKYYKEAENLFNNNQLQAKLNSFILLASTYHVFTLRPFLLDCKNCEKLCELLPTIEGLSEQYKQLQIDTQQFSQDIETLISEIPTKLKNIPTSRDAVNARISFVNTLLVLKKNVLFEIPETDLNIYLQQQELQLPARLASKVLANEAVNLLAEAVKQANKLKNKRLEVNALAMLGKVYQENAYTFPENSQNRENQLKQSKKITEKALKLAQSIRAKDIVPQLNGQLAQVTNDRLLSCIFYNNAVRGLEDIRADLVSVNPEIQYNFRDKVEPFYREAAACLLEEVEKKPQDEQEKQKKLEEARQLIELLQLAELNNFFREICIQGKVIDIDKFSEKAENSKTAIIYPIILPDKLQIIAKVPNQKGLILNSFNRKKSEVEDILQKLREAISDPAKTNAKTTNFKKYAPEVYKWLIKPLEPSINKNVDTLVFVLDGLFSNIPMSVLYDEADENKKENKYLIEKYAIAVSPGLQLLAPTSIAGQKLKVLAGGLEKPSDEALDKLPEKYRRLFGALKKVKEELIFIKDKIPNTEEVKADKFTGTFLENKINTQAFNIVHLITHGVFSSNLENTFLLGYDGVIDVKKLTTILQSREKSGKTAIELLILSACQTATGDKRAALGLAAIAVRTGVKSTLATLWSVREDTTTEFNKAFYQSLTAPKSNVTKANVTKAKALQKAQQEILKQNRDNYSIWAPYILVGNWL